MFNMTKVKDDSIKMRIRMYDKTGKFIPKGLTEFVNILIVDGFASFQFDHAQVCKKFVAFAQEKQTYKSPEQTVYNERAQKAITKYNGKNKEEIHEIIKNQLKLMNLNAR